MQSPEVSVIIPTWNRAAMVRRALESCRGQTMTGFEIIVCDNASTDDTAQVVNDFISNNPRLRVNYMRHEENIGPGRNWFSGVRVAQGALIKVLFSDDELTPSSLVTLTRAIEEKGVSAVFGRVQFTWKKSFLVGCKILAEDQFGLDDMLCDFFAPSFSHNSYPVSPGAGIFRRECIAEINESELSTCGPYNVVDTGIGIDIFWYLAAWRKLGVAAVPDVVARFHGHDGSITVTSGHERLDKHNLSSLIYRAKLDPGFAEFLEPWLARILNGESRLRNVQVRKRIIEEHYSPEELDRIIGMDPRIEMSSSWRKRADVVTEKIKLRLLNPFRT